MKFSMCMLLGITGALASCASISGSPNQAIQITTNDPEGLALNGALCVLSNTRGRWSVRTPGSVIVPRSSESLQVSCTAEDGSAGVAKLASSIRGAALGNILIGGVVGIAVDHISGAGYSFDEQLTVVLHRTPTKP